MSPALPQDDKVAFLIMLSSAIFSDFVLTAINAQSELPEKTTTKRSTCAAFVLSIPNELVSIPSIRISLVSAGVNAALPLLALNKSRLYVPTIGTEPKLTDISFPTVLPNASTNLNISAVPPGDAT
ncbi:hypothetical protein BSF42_44640 [Flavobacterium sp. ACN6]|nr:hypothetical protein BSF42_44640 [Flavobacterium sp. ACN6]